jgi:predicted RNase H-like HicB family nuclease
MNSPKEIPTVEADGYKVVVEHNPDSGWVVGEVIELPGCYTEAPDMAALEVAMREAVELYLETINATDG